MDDMADLALLWPRKALRYRVAITIIDTQAGAAKVLIYDSNTVELSHGHKERDPFSGQMAQAVRLRMPGAVRLSASESESESDEHEGKGEQR